MTRTFEHRMIRHPRPMATFDPSKPAMVYADINDFSFEWDPARDEASYDEYSELELDGVVNWDGLLLSGWCTLDEWEREWRSTIVASPLDPRAAPLVWVEPVGSGYAITEFGPYTAEDEAWFREQTQALPIKPCSFTINRLRDNSVLFWQFEPPLDPSDHIRVLKMIERELERYHPMRRPFATPVPPVEPPSLV
jgi:hypothetical protein